MANWKYTLYIQDLLDQCDDGDLSIIDCGKRIAARIRGLNMVEVDERLENLLLNLESVDDNEAQFIDVMEDIYQWADDGYRLFFRILADAPGQ
jgi:zona occludens toxin (predicted ATPase)